MTENLEEQYNKGLELKLSGSTKRHKGLGYTNEEDKDSTPAKIHKVWTDDDDDKEKTKRDSKQNEVKEHSDEKLKNTSERKKKNKDEKNKIDQDVKKSLVKSEDDSTNKEIKNKLFANFVKSKE